VQPIQCDLGQPRLEAALMGDSEMQAPFRTHRLLESARFTER
jgi:hypothetical protein